MFLMKMFGSALDSSPHPPNRTGGGGGRASFNMT